MYQDDPLEPEGGYAPSYYQGHPLENAPKFPEAEMTANLEDISTPVDTFTFEPVNVPQPPMFSIDTDKITSLEDIKSILKALNIQCTADVLKDFNLEHLIKD